MNVPAKLGKLTNKVQILASKHSPEIWLGMGIVAIVGGTIWACKASRNLDDILEEHDVTRSDLEYEHKDELEDLRSDGKTPDEDTVVALEKAYKKECAKVTLQTGVTIVREYAPAVILITGGIGMIVNGHRILCKRNATLLAAYSALDQSFTDYRGRVRERFGEQVEDDIYNGTTYVDNTRTEVGEDGKKKKIKEKVPVVGTSVSPYARFFDEANSKEWTRSPSYNRTFVICQQNSANDRLRAKGYLFLNEVYRMLGMSETPTGAICGWILPEEHDPLHEGDNYVDFRIFDGTDPSKVAFVNGEEQSVLLDFNCQGIIYDKI